MSTVVASSALAGRSEADDCCLSSSLSPGRFIMVRWAADGALTSADVLVRAAWERVTVGLVMRRSRVRFP